MGLLLPRAAGLATSGSRAAIGGGFARQQARVAAGGARRAGHSRALAVVAVSRLVLRPTGDGSCEHLGDGERPLPLPAPIPLEDGVFEVGRAAPADIRINVPTVSSRHALLRVEDNKVCVTDLNSTNGTVVDGRELGPMDNVEVAVGGEVIFGDQYLARFTLEEEDRGGVASGGGGIDQQQGQQRRGSSEGGRGRGATAEVSDQASAKH